MAVRLGGEEENRISHRMVPHHAMPVRLHVVTAFGMEHQALVTSAALRAPVAGHVVLTV